MDAARLVLKGCSNWAVLLGWLPISLATGCVGPAPPVAGTATPKISAPAVVFAQPSPTGWEPTAGAQRSAVVPVAYREEDKAAAKQPAPVSTTSNPAPAPLAAGDVPCRPLTLPEAVALAFQLQPRLRSALESIEQAASRQDIVRAAFLPTATVGYHVGGFDLNVGGEGIPLGQGAQALAQHFTFIPFTGALPVGLNINTGYEVAELKVQWLICDFGRRLGRSEQAALARDIAHLQAERARQTVANEVAVSYYQILRARSLRRIAASSVRRAEDDLATAEKLVKGGAEVREVVLRARVQLSVAQRAADLAEEAEGTAVAAFNLAVGLKGGAFPVLDDASDVPPLGYDLAACLQAAVAQRQEFAVAQRAIEVAQTGVRIAKADFAPRVVAEGALLDFQQANPRGHADLALGLIKLEWNLFEGGKRVAEKRLADSRIRDALAQSEEVADTIAFQVNRAWLQVVASRKAIDRSRPAVESARENHRLVRARLKAGDAIAAEVVDAEATLTKAEQDYQNALYDYRTALVRLDYAVGTSANPAPQAPTVVIGPPSH